MKPFFFVRRSKPEKVQYQEQSKVVAKEGQGQKLIDPKLPSHGPRTLIWV